MIPRLINEWSQRACGLTIDIIGDSRLSTEVQWIIAAPVDARNPDELLTAFEMLRTELGQLGLQMSAEEHHHPEAALPNGVALETKCPYRPESCLGDHLVATGHGLARDVTSSLAVTNQSASSSVRTKHHMRSDFNNE